MSVLRLNSVEHLNILKSRMTIQYPTRCKTIDVNDRAKVLPHPGISYPTRCRVVDVDGKGYTLGYHTLTTPDISKPYIGKEGIAKRIGPSVLITLDNGEQLNGHDCWWEPIAK